MFRLVLLSSCLASIAFAQVVVTGKNGKTVKIGTGATIQVDVLDALRKSLAGGSADYWQKGALASSARVEVDLPGSLRLEFDVTAYKGGGISVDAQFNNDQAMQASGGRVSYEAVVRMNGQEVARESVNQGQYQNWHRGFSTDARNGGQGLGDASQGWLNIRHDMEHLEGTGAVAQYDQAVGVSPALLEAYATAAAAPGWAAPLAADGVTRFMPATGGRQDIGFTTTPGSVPSFAACTSSRAFSKTLIRLQRPSTSFVNAAIASCNFRVNAA
jgi:hypothetical protein